MINRAVAVLALVAGGLVVTTPSHAAPSDPTVTYTDARFDDTATETLQGELTSIVSDDFDHHASSEAYAVATDDGDLVPVSFTREVPTGEFVGEVVTEDSTEEDPAPVAEASIEPTSSAQEAPAVTPTAHRAYVARLVDQGSVDGTDQQVGAAVDEVLDYWVTEAGGAISSFEQQGAIRDLDSTGDVPPSQGCGYGGSSGPWPLWNQAEDLFPDVNFNANGNHLVVLVGDECVASPGVATIGRSGLASGGRSVLRYTPSTFDHTGAHELGHNFGLEHANRDACSGDRCEYYDLYSPMGLAVSGANPAFGPPALGTLYRDELGLTSDAEVTRVASDSDLTQTFTLSPRAGASGRRGLLVTDPATGTEYSVDYRSRTARDATSFYGSSANLSNGPRYPKGVVIERQAARGATFLTVRDTSPASGAFPADTTFAPSDRLSVRIGPLGTTATVTVSLTGVEPEPDPEPSEPPASDEPTVVPTVSGTAAVGQTVTADEGSWPAGTTFTYAWQVDGSTVGTAKDLLVPDTAVGKALTVAVSGTTNGLTTTRESAARTVRPGTLSPGTPTITGPPRVGATLTAAPGTWSPTPTLAYAWTVGSTTIGTARTLVVPASAVGARITLSVTGSRTGYTTSAPVTATSSTVAPGTLVTSAPRISGTAKVGRTLTAVAGTWTSGTQVSYQWFVGTTRIAGATARTYTIPKSRAGKRMSVRVTGAKAGFVTVTRVSAATGKVAK